MILKRNLQCIHRNYAAISLIAPGRAIMVSLIGWMLILGMVACSTFAHGGDLDAVLKAGKLRHLAIPYANFVYVDGDGGLDVELMQRFAAYLKVDYEFVQSTWTTIIPDLTGKTVQPRGDDVVITGNRPVRGDVIATGFTVLPWRTRIVDFATASFPSGVWLIAHADSKMRPVSPSGSIHKDIEMVKAEMHGYSVLALKDSCLDPKQYQLEKTGAVVHLLDPQRNLDEMIPLVIARTVDTTLMDVPVALVALERWPGKIKVVGPISEQQEMAPAFAQASPRLRTAYEAFFKELKAQGIYKELVTRYYPTVFPYYPDFF
jgi:ABC-type amino acid transport substrate-binding protein